MLTPSDIEEYRQMWREEFHEEISEADARESARLLIEFSLALYEPPEGDEDEDLDQTINTKSLAPSRDQRILNSMTKEITLEDLGSLMANGFADTHKRFDVVEGQLDRVAERCEAVETRLISMEKRLANQITELSDKVSAVNEKLLDHAA